MRLKADFSSVPPFCFQNWNKIAFVACTLFGKKKNLILSSSVEEQKLTIYIFEKFNLELFFTAVSVLNRRKWSALVFKGIVQRLNSRSSIVLTDIPDQNECLEFVSVLTTS